jgi:hypothetical protein
MTTPSDADIANVLTKLALNYGRTLDGEAADEMMTMWRVAIGGCKLEDIAAALAAVLSDDRLTRFPTVAEFRQRVIAANRARRQAQADAHDGGPVDCLACNDTGWIDQGHNEDGCHYVAPCPQGCLPPATNRVRRAMPKRRPPAERHQQLALQQPALAAAVEATHRMVGDREPIVDLDEPF